MIRGAHGVRPRPRPGHDQFARARLRPRRRRARHGPAGAQADLSRARLGRARSDGNLGDAVGRDARGAREGGHHGPRRRGHRHHEPARDDAPLGARDGASARERDRLAGPKNRADVRRAPRGRPRGGARREDRPRPRRLFFWHEVEVAARPLAGGACSRGEGRARLRHDRHVARLEAHEWGRARDRRLECKPDAALRHPHRDMGRRAPRALRRSERSPAPRRLLLGSDRSGGARRSGRSGGSDRGHRGGSAGGPLRAGLRPARPREEHLRHRLFPAPQHRGARGPLEKPPAHDRRLGPRRRPHLRPRGQRLRRGRRRAMAEGRAETHPDGRRRRGARRERDRQRGRVHGAGLRGARRAALGPLRAGRRLWAHPRLDRRASRARGSRVDRLPERRRPLRHGEGRRRHADRAARRRPRHRERAPHAVPGRSPRRARRPARGPRDDRPRRRVSRRPRRRLLEGRRRDTRELDGRPPLRACVSRDRAAALRAAWERAVARAKGWA